MSKNPVATAPSSDLYILDREFILRLVYIHRDKVKPVSLCVFYERSRGIKSEWIVVEHRGHEACPVMHDEVRGGVGEQSETERVRFGKAVVCECTRVVDDLFLHVRGNASLSHAVAK